MEDDAEHRRRRSRHRPARGGASAAGPDPAGPTATTTEVHDPAPEAARGRRGQPGPSPAEDRDGERGLRGLVGSGSSQVRVGAALRARDAARPTEADLAEAEREVVVVRRNWVPREDLPRSGR
jgi:hypothetical protein